MMNDDFALDWQNIEYALNESEFILLNEFKTQKYPFKQGRMGELVQNTVFAPAYLTAQATRAGLKQIVNHDYSQIGKGKSLFGITDGRIFKSRFFKADFWNQLLTRIREIWNRFVNIIMSIFKTDKTFTDQELYNAEATIRNAVLEEKLGFGQANIQFHDIYPFWAYGRDNIEQIQIPGLNIRDNRMMNCLDDKNTFANYYIRGLNTIDFNDGDCVNALKNLFRSAPASTITVHDIMPHLKFMVNFCSSSNQLIANLKQEQNNIEVAGRDMIRELRQSGVFQEDSNLLEDFDGNYEQTRQEELAKDVLRVKNYVSVCQTIIGAKMSVLSERSKQIIGILRECLKHCKAAATKAEVENVRASHNVTEENPEELNVKKYGNNMIGNFNARREANNLIKNRASAEERGVTFSKEYMDSLPSSKRKLEKRIEKIEQERDNVINFVKKQKIKNNSPEFQDLYSYIQNYDNQLAALHQKLDGL